MWTEWAVGYRDVIVLDAQRNVLDVYNLSDNDLGDPDRYTELGDILRSAAE